MLKIAQENAQDLMKTSMLYCFPATFHVFLLLPCSAWFFFDLLTGNCLSTNPTVGSVFYFFLSSAVNIAAIFHILFYGFICRKLRGEVSSRVRTALKELLYKVSFRDALWKDTSTASVLYINTRQSTLSEADFLKENYETFRRTI